MVTVSRRRALRAVGAAALAGVAGCTGGGDAGDADGPEVEMTDDLTFEPAEIEITAGETLTWTNVGSIEHSVTAYGDAIPEGADYFASGGHDGEEAARDAYPSDPIGGTETYEHAFEVAGTYEYFCIPHESTMTGSVVVTD